MDTNDMSEENNDLFKGIHEVNKLFQSYEQKFQTYVIIR